MDGRTANIRDWNKLTSLFYYTSLIHSIDMAIQQIFSRQYIDFINYRTALNQEIALFETGESRKTSIINIIYCLHLLVSSSSTLFAW